ncbi:MAG: MoaD/ThiS family protein [Candidatus Bathyarchaeota archaeon]|nr:MoaD/ThiS family protein [Candidatus Bathyarchaeota archaeon]
MRVKVIYLGVVRHKVGKSEEEYELSEGSSLKDLLIKIAESNRSINDLISGIGDNPIDPTLIITLNGFTVNPANIGCTALRDGDTLALMTVIGGG